jgi:RNA polymerase sigma factor (sigma-70 family)
MNNQIPVDDELQEIINRFNRGDPQARDELVDRAYERLRRLTSRALHGFPQVARWEQTDDVLQLCALALHRALGEVRPQNVRAFMGLAALQIRRKLIDLARQYNGPEGIGANHATDFKNFLAQIDNPADLHPVVDKTAGPLTLQLWTEFHQTIDQLPPEELEVFDLIYYHGLSQVEVAKLLDLSERTVKRRWRAAKLFLYERLG